MGALSQADRYLLDQVRQGSAAGWSQLVERYQGRLLAFARRRIGASPEAEDLVQETFISFLQGLARFREEAGIETYLFLILRRKIANWARSRRGGVCSLQEAFGGADAEAGAVEPAGDEPTASWYVRRDEEHARQRAALSQALRTVLGELKDGRHFADLQIIEMIFYAQLRNGDVARIANVRENHVAVVKHRLLARLRKLVGATCGQATADSEAAAVDPPDALLTEIWTEERLSCLKRSTIGAMVLGALEPDWQAYAEFHLEQLGCQFCRANLEDMQSAIQEAPAEQVRARILESTVGFFQSSQA